MNRVDLSRPRSARPALDLATAARSGTRSEEVAVIDVGSNTARLVIFETTPEGGFRSTFEAKEVPRLGQGLNEDGSLAPEAVDRGVAALRRFARQLDEAGNPPVVGVATSAVRDAPNGPGFVDEVRHATGLSLRILSGEEEARYAYLGVAGAWEVQNDLVIDIGGGSLQAATTRAGSLDRVSSLPLGALRLTEAFLHHDPPKGREVDALEEHVRRVLARLPRLRSAGGRVFGVGGTIRCLGRVAIEVAGYPIPQVHGFALRRRDVEAVGAILFEMDAAERRNVPGVGGHRADVILAGLLVVEEVFRRTGAGSLSVSGTGIREGIALERANVRLPAPTEELALRSVAAVARAFGFSLPHGEEVRRTALELFELLRPRFGWSPADRAALLVAASLHDLGTVVDRWRHPRHSAYLIRHMPILGLTHRELLIAALSTYLHEGDDPPGGWRKEFHPILGEEELALVRAFGAILEFAEATSGARIALARVRGSGKLRLLRRGRGAEGPSERVLGRLARSMRRGLGVEVVLPDD